MSTRKRGRLATISLVFLAISAISILHNSLSLLRFDHRNDSANDFFHLVVLGLNNSPSLPGPLGNVGELPIHLKAPRIVAEDLVIEYQDHKELPGHIYGDDGLLTVNPEGSHPIYELIERARDRWAEKLERASKTLDDAVIEYKRRYHRPPPEGFDLWWKYVEEHNVQLPDEYDQIYKDLEPFWGIDPVQLQESQKDWESHGETYTIGKSTRADPITVLNFSLAAGQESRFLENSAQPQIKLLKDIQHLLPPFRAVFSPHDNPNMLSDGNWRRAALNAAAEGTYMKIEDLPQEREYGWAAACSPDSPLGQNPIQPGTSATPQTKKTFIYDHRRAMDVCAHPQLVLLHGQFLRWLVDPTPERTVAPQFSNCATALHGDIHATPTYMTEQSAGDSDLPWEEKMDDRLLWRGKPTGIWLGDDLPWMNSHRLRLVHGVNDMSKKTVHVLPPTASDNESIGPGREIPLRRLNAAMMDIHFTDDVTECEEESCKVMDSTFEYRQWQTPETAAKYKYIMDVDGHGWSGRFRRLMSMNSVIFKSTIYPEWFTDRVEPWVHYVPIQVDYSDLYDVLSFFSGDLSGDDAHDEMARNIGHAGRMWTEQYWRQEDMTAYMFRLYLEYARVMSTDRTERYYGRP